MPAPFMNGKFVDNGLVPCLCNHFIPPYNPGEIAGFDAAEAKRLAGILNKVTGVPAVTILTKLVVVKYHDGNEPGDFLALEEKEAKELIKKGHAKLAPGAQNPTFEQQVEVAAIMHSKDPDAEIDKAKAKKAKRVLG